MANLRNPSMREKSATMLRILKKEKLCITNNGGWFTEIPNSVVYKIELDQIQENIEKAILTLIKDEKKCTEFGQKARENVNKEYNSETIANNIFDFLRIT